MLLIDEHGSPESLNPAGLLRTQTVAWFIVKHATVELTSFARKVCYLL